MGPMERGCSKCPSIRNSLILQKFIAQNKVQQRFIYYEQPKFKVFYYVKKFNTLKVRQVANIRYCTGHYTFLQPVKNLKMFTQSNERCFQGSLWSQFRQLILTF